MAVVRDLIRSPVRSLIRGPTDLAGGGSPLSISFGAFSLETTDQPYTLNDVTFADTGDTGLAEYEVTLEVGSPGEVYLSQTTGLTFSVGDGAGGTAHQLITFTGTLANINAANIIIKNFTTGSTSLSTILTNTTTSTEVTRLVDLDITAPAVTVPPDVEYLVVAGGGGAGGMTGPSGWSPAGGGAGGYRTATGYSVTAGAPITVTVGAGGGGGAAGASGSKGSDSVFGTITSEGGGYGAGGVGADVTGGNGGSGGGGYKSGANGAATGGQGNNGASGQVSGTSYGGGGGGGAGSVGSQSSGTGVGAGGSGLNWNSLGTTYAAGGNGGDYAAGSAAGVAGTANRGNGGNAALGSAANAGGAGGSGIVIIRYSDAYSLAASTTGSPTQTTTGGYHYYTWTASGSVTF
jgi:hypothetical protein